MKIETIKLWRRILKWIDEQIKKEAKENAAPEAPESGKDAG